jgi:hypothetical protein
MHSFFNSRGENKLYLDIFNILLIISKLITTFLPPRIKSTLQPRLKNYHLQLIV